MFAPDCFTDVIRVRSVSFFAYHSLANPEKSHRYVAVNEVIVGSTSVFAPLAAGLLADAAKKQCRLFISVRALIVLQ